MVRVEVFNPDQYIGIVIANTTSCLREVFAKNTSLDTKFPSPFGSGNFSSLDWYFWQLPLPNMIYLYKIGYNCFIIFQYYYLKIKSLKFLKLFENFMKILKSYEIFESFEIFWQFWIFWKSLKFWNFFKILKFYEILIFFWQFDWPTGNEISSLDGQRWTPECEVNSLWGTTKKVLFRPISEQQNSFI